MHVTVQCARDKVHVTVQCARDSLHMIVCMRQCARDSELIG